jgi:hypothetical protein
MTVQHLIYRLQQFPKHIEVCVFDWRKNIYNSNGDPCSIGIKPVEELVFENIDTNIPFVSITYNNCDYTDKGEANAGSLILDNAHKE